LENIEHDNEIWAEFFVPLTILRLTKGLDEQTKEIDCPVTLINIKKPGRRKKSYTFDGRAKPQILILSLCNPIW
jgi:hypothetical protein